MDQTTTAITLEIHAVIAAIGLAGLILNGWRAVAELRREVNALRR